MSTTNGSQASSFVQLSYQLIRNTTSPDEAKTGVKSFVVNVPALEILKFGTRDNLRGYIAEFNPRKRNWVHEAIRNTISTERSRFITRNSGFVIVASEIEVNDEKKNARLRDASIINGAQSQGEIRQWIQETYGEDLDPQKEEVPFYVRAEIIVDSDPGQIVETAIARNTATPVKSISQAGARGHLDELEQSIQLKRPEIKIRKRETDEDVYDTRKILQYARLLMPAGISGNESPSEKLRPYKNPEQCLTEFSEWYDKRDSDPVAKKKYEFTVKIAPHAILEYEYWERNEGWNGQRLWEATQKGGRACRRDKQGRIVWVSPGLIFPILGAISEFVREDGQGGWSIVKPSQFKPADMISRAMSQFRACDSDPMTMGRDAGVYDALRIYPQTLVQVMRDMNVAGK